VKKIVLSFVIFLLTIAAAAAHGEEDFHNAEELIESGASCDELSDEQLELIGDYYMEQMHPGEAHERMDAMMGGEGSESLKQMHINMAGRLYCNENAGMMEVQYVNYANAGGGNMMGRSGSMMSFPWFWGFGMFWGFFFMIVFWGLIIWLIVWLIGKYAKPKESAIEVLKNRYAKGEISKKQFEKMKKELI
jgi:uncharacterized membrane protein